MSDTPDSETGSYLPGEIVDIRLAFVPVLAAGAGMVTVAIGDQEVSLPAVHHRHQIWRIRPADGQPKPGELWEDRFGRVWFAHGGSDGEVRFVGADAKAMHPGQLYLSWQSANTSYGPLRRIREATGTIEAGSDG